jgi:DNA-binding LytR/AlgR family response regulator
LPPNFLRVRRPVIANLSLVQRPERDGDGWRLHMREGAPLPVSRSRQAALRDAMDVPPRMSAAVGLCPIHEPRRH